MDTDKRRETVRRKIQELENQPPSNPKEFVKREKQLDELYALLYRLTHPPR